MYNRGSPKLACASTVAISIAAASSVAIVHLLHTAAAATAHRLNQDRPAKFIRKALCFVQAARFASRHARESSRNGVRPRFEFVANGIKLLNRRTDETYAHAIASCGQLLILRKKTISRMNRVSFVRNSCGNDRFDIQITCRRVCGANANRSVSQSRAHGIQIRFGSCQHGFNAKPLTRSNDAHGDFASAASLARALTERDDVVPIAAVTVPLPKSVLAKRPDHYAHGAVAPAELYKKVERAVFVVGAARSIGDARARDIMQGSAVRDRRASAADQLPRGRNRPVIVLLQDHVTSAAKLVAADIDNDRCVLESEGTALVPVAACGPSTTSRWASMFMRSARRARLERTLTEGLVSARRPARAATDPDLGVAVAWLVGRWPVRRARQSARHHHAGLAAGLAEPQLRDRRRRFLGVAPWSTGRRTRSLSRGGRAGRACPYLPP